MEITARAAGAVKMVLVDSDSKPIHFGQALPDGRVVTGGNAPRPLTPNGQVWIDGAESDLQALGFRWVELEREEP